MIEASDWDRNGIKPLIFFPNDFEGRGERCFNLFQPVSTTTLGFLDAKIKPRPLKLPERPVEKAVKNSYGHVGPQASLGGNWLPSLFKFKI